MSTEIIKKFIECQKTGKPSALATIVDVEGSSPRAAGTKMLVYESGKIEGTVGGGVLEASVIENAVKQIKTGVSKKFVFDLKEQKMGMGCGGKVEVFIEVNKAGVKLLILGAGHVAEAISKVSDTVNIPYIVVDDRADFASKERFPNAMDSIVGDPSGILNKLNIDEKTFVIIVTRSHQYDEDCFIKAVKTKAGYIGLIGSSKKLEKTFQRCGKEKINIKNDARVYAPIGIDIGDKSPGGIAVSIMAEILSVINNTSGKHMREQQGSK